MNIADIDNPIDQCKKDGPALLKHPQTPLFIAPVAFDAAYLERSTHTLRDWLGFCEKSLPGAMRFVALGCVGEYLDDQFRLSFEMFMGIVSRTGHMQIRIEKIIVCCGLHSDLHFD